MSCFPSLLSVFLLIAVRSFVYYFLCVGRVFQHFGPATENARLRSFSFCLLKGQLIRGAKAFWVVLSEAMIRIHWPLTMNTLVDQQKYFHFEISQAAVPIDQKGVK